MHEIDAHEPAALQAFQAPAVPYAKRRIAFSDIGVPFPFLPYAWGVLRAYAEADPRVRCQYVFDEPLFIAGPAASIVERIHAPSVLALSCYIWNLPLQMNLCRLVKSRYPECVTVAGGPQIPSPPGDFFELHPQVDVLVHHEGEIPFLELLVELLEDVPDLSRVPGVSFRRQGKVVSTPPSPGLPPQITALPSPFLLGYFDPLVETLKRQKGQVWTVWETNRGCPYGCSFCAWGEAARGRMKQFETDRLAAELRRLAELEVDAIMCIDANFGIAERDLDLTHQLVAERRKTGYPKYFFVNFAKDCGDRVFEMSRALHSVRLFRGTNLSMQTTDEAVLAAVDRKTMGLPAYATVKSRYEQADIPTWTDMMLGLPKQTRASWMQGMIDLMRTGHHDDIRCFEAMLLPNTPLSTPEARRQYGLKTVHKRLHPFLGDDAGKAEVICETNTLSRQDWIECLVFTDFVVATLHNGGYTRFLSIFLDHEGFLEFSKFYVDLFELHLAHPTSFIGQTIGRLIRLQQAYLDDPEILFYGRLRSQPDMWAQVAHCDHRGKSHWGQHDWAWMRIHDEHDRFYGEIRAFVDDRASVPREKIDDVMAFQRDRMLRVEYDPRKAKSRRYEFNWPRYFHGDGVLAQEPVVVRYSDVAMGPLGEDALLCRDPRAFALAALGNYFPDGRYRRCLHQRDAMEVLPENENGAMATRARELIRRARSLLGRVIL